MPGRLTGCLVVLAAASLVGARAGWSTRGIVGADQQVYVVPAAGGKTQQVTQGDLAAHSPSWAPDGNRLAYVRGTQISVLDRQAGTTKSIVFNLLTSQDPPAWTPDGRRIAFTALTSPEGRASISVVGSTGSGVKSLATTPWGTGDDQRGPVWSPDGTRLAFCLQGPAKSSGGVRASGDLDLAVVTLSGARERLTADPGNEFDPDWSPDGRTILYATDTALRVVPSTGGRSRLVVRLHDVWGASWSPNGKLIAFTGSRPGESRAHLYVVRPDGSGLRRLTGEVTARPPAWAPNGRLIAFATYRTGIDAVAPDGSGRRTVVTLANADIGHLAWSPDGRTIGFDARKQAPGS